MLGTGNDFKLIVQMFKIWGESQHFLDGFDRFFLGFPRKQKVGNSDWGVGQNWYSDPKFSIHIKKLSDNLWLD